jgi:hypothetical protein
MLTARVLSWNDELPEGNNFSVSKIHLSTATQTHRNLISKPMTNWRDRTDLCTLFPELAEGFKDVKDGDAVLDIWCGQGNTLKELAFLLPCSTLTWVDKQEVKQVKWAPNLYNIDYLQGDIEDESTWKKIPENNKFVLNFFAAMYLKDPFQLLIRIQEKLAKEGEAFIHLGYLEQYAWGEAMIRKQLACLSPDAISIKKPLSAAVYHRPTKETDMYVANLRAKLHPIMIKITPQDDLSSLAHLELKAKKSLYIEHEGVKYMLPYSDQWYIYKV